MAATPLQPRSTRPIVPSISGLGSSAAAASAAASYQHEFRPVTPRVTSGGGGAAAANGAGGATQQQPVAAHYRAGSGSAGGGGGIVGSVSDPFEKDKRGPISATLAEARAIVQHMDAQRGSAGAADRRPASLTEVSRPFTPRMARRSSPYNPTSSPSPAAGDRDPFPSPPDSPARFSSRPSLSNPAFGSPAAAAAALHRQGSGSSVGGDDDEEPMVLPPRTQSQQQSQHKQLTSKRSNSGEEAAFAEIDASAASRPDSAVSSSGGSSRPSSSSNVVVSGASRSRSASTASPNAFARRPPMPGAGVGAAGSVAVPELVFPCSSAGSDEDWRMVEQQPGEETSRPGTAAGAGAAPLSRQTSGLRVGAGAVAITPALSPGLAPSPPQQPRPPSGSPSTALRPRSRPSSSSSSATSDALLPASSNANVSGGTPSKSAAATGGSSRPNSSSQPARTSPQLASEQSAGGISVGIKPFDSTVAAGAAAAPAAAAAARPSSALFARPLDVSSAPIGGDNTATAAGASSSAAPVAAVPATSVLDLPALRALHASWCKSSVVDKPELLRELLTASYRSLSHAAKSAAAAAAAASAAGTNAGSSPSSSSSADLTVLIGFVLSLPLGGGGDGPASKLHTLASKLVFEVSRDARNDSALVAILPAINTAILARPQGERGLKALSYALGALHNLSVEGSGASGSSTASALCSQPLVDSLANLLREETYRRALHVHSEEEAAKLGVEVTGVLRNIACAPGSHRLFCNPITVAASAAATTAANKDAQQPASSCLDILCHLTMRLSQHAALLLNLTRILSKLSLHQSCRAIMYAPTPMPPALAAAPPAAGTASAAAPSLAVVAPAAPLPFLPCLVRALHLHHVKLSLCIRVLYILGNLTMQNDECRRTIVECVCRPATKPDSTTARAVEPSSASPPKASASSKAEKDGADSLDSTEELTGAEVLLTLLARSYQRDSKLRKLIAGAAATSTTAASAAGSAAASSAAATAAASASLKKHSTMLHENEELLVKLIRLLANLSINPAIGARLVSDRRIGNLLRLLKYKTVECHEELVLNTVSAITNLSFYLKPAAAAAAAANAGSRPASAKDSAAAAASASPTAELLFTPPRDVLGLLLSFLFSSNLDLLSETLRALGNFSRDWGFRLLMGAAHSRAEEAVVLLLDHEDMSVLYGAVGVVLNIAAHPQQQGVLFEAQCSACHKLCEAMERFGGSEGEEEEPAEDDEDADEHSTSSEPEWGLLSMVLKTFLNLRVPAPAPAAGAAAASSSARPLSPSSTDSLVLKREVDGDVRLHLLHVLDQILARCEIESERIRAQIADADAAEDAEAGEDTVAMQQLLRVVGEVNTLAQQLLPACSMPAAWQQQD